MCWVDDYNDYRYGINGMEKDDNIKGTGNSYDYGARMYDSRLGRWLSIDLLFAKRPFLTPYSYVGNSPLLNHELDGNDYEVYIDHENKTIIIKATYYIKTGDEGTWEKALKATQFWNDQSGKYQYQVGKGKEKILYDIQFELIVEEVEDPNSMMTNSYTDLETGFQSIMYNGKQKGTNTFTVIPDEDFKETKNNLSKNTKGGMSKDAGGFVMNGNAVAVPETEKEEEISAHEVGHTLGLSHYSGTMMGENTLNLIAKLTPILVEGILSNANVVVDRYDNKSPAGSSVKSTGSAPSGFSNGRVIKKKQWKLF